MSDRWFRVYETLIDDPKVQRLPDRLFKALINTWCIASANDGKMPPVDDIAFKLRLKPDQAIKVLGELTEAGFFDHPDNDPDTVTPHNWNGRQFKSDVSSTERVREYRKRKKTVVSETFHLRCMKHHQKHPQIQIQIQRQKEEEKTLCPLAKNFGGFTRRISTSLRDAMASLSPDSITKLDQG